MNVRTSPDPHRAAPRSRVAALGALAGTLVAACASPRSEPRDRFERITPEAAGYSAERLAELPALLAAAGSESLLLLHDGRVFFEWGDIHRKRLVHSIRKALLNGLMGTCYAEGRVDLQATLAELGIDDIPPSLTAEEKRATLEQVLQSRSGVYHEAAAESEGMSSSRPARGSHAPGTHWYYNNWDFNVAGRVFEQLSGTSVFDAFAARIAEPLGMVDFANRIVPQPDGSRPVGDDADGYYQLEPDRSRYPAWHFRLSAHDLALYGQLYLQRGSWNGRQIVPAEWIDRSTQPVSIVDERYGLAYGMLWDVLVPEAGDEHPSFFHTGAGVHMLGVYPKHKLVFVHRVDTEGGRPFDDGDLYRIIRLVHDARVPPAQTAPAER